MDDAIRYFRGEFTKGKATSFIYFIKTLKGKLPIDNIYKFI